MKFFKSSPIILEKVDLGETKVSIPVVDLKGQQPGPTIVITAGMDGDEYTGIQAAYQLIDLYSNLQFSGRLIILPVMNIPGFFTGKGINSLDNKYPKHIFPGDSSGSSSQRLIDWLNANYLKGATIWLDLHSGAMTERLNPFVWTYETKNEQVNNLTKRLLANIESEIKIYEKTGMFSKAEKLAKRNCTYVMFESGEKGEQNKKHIEQMIMWVKQSLEAIWNKKSINKETSCYREVMIYQAKKQGLWEININSKEVMKGDVVGRVLNLAKKELQKIVVKKTGVVLWAKSSLFANVGDDLIAVASN